MATRNAQPDRVGARNSPALEPCGAHHRYSTRGPNASPMRLLEVLLDRFGAFEAIANASIMLARSSPEAVLPMDLLVADALLEFGEDLREALAAANEWAHAE
ncbi:MAG TPA: hypothetical protein VIB55_10475 [Longimicrobium sp.]